MHDKVFVLETEKGLSIKGAETQYKKFLPPYSICVSCIATPGLVAVTSTESHTNQQINSIVVKKDISIYYCYFAMKEMGNTIRARGSGGSVYLNLSKSKFSVLPVLIPSLKVMKKYQQMISPFMDAILLHAQESRTLTELRDTLLPKLISGNLRVPEEFLQNLQD